MLTIAPAAQVCDNVAVASLLEPKESVRPQDEVFHGTHAHSSNEGNEARSIMDRMRKHVNSDEDCVLSPADSQTVLIAYDTIFDGTRELESFNAKLFTENEHLQASRDKLHKELEDCKVKKVQELSEADAKFYTIYEAEASHQQDCCKLCDITEEH